jgi:hypothetical protein
MDFYRHRYADKDDFFSDIIDNLNNWGFRSFDNSPVTQIPNSSEGDFYLVKWKYDALYNSDKTASGMANLYPYRIFKNTTGSGKMGLTFYFFGRSCEIQTNTLALFFIPLKNKGFLLRLMASPYTMTPEFKPYFEHFRVNPYSSPGIYKCAPGTGDTQYLGFNYIGLFSNNNINNPMNYFIMGGKPLTKYYKNGLENPPIWSYDPGSSENDTALMRFIINSQIFNYPNFIDNGYILYEGTKRPSTVGDEGVLPPLETVDINQNVCTLIRAPHDNSYIDGLYLITTSPMESVDGKVFSFGGRNFLGVCRNLVVELPAD